MYRSLLVASYIDVGLHAMEAKKEGPSKQFWKVSRCAKVEGVGWSGMGWDGCLVGWLPSPPTTTPR